jgi:Lon protease-like protein
VSEPPLDVRKILGEFGGVARLFPLPSLVLFPDSFAPLNVFEPRYLSMVQEAVAGDGLIAMALLKPGWEEAYNGNPPIHPVTCLGKILRYRKLPNDKYEMLLYGMVRAQIVEEFPSEPFRRAKVEVVEDLIPEAKAAEVAGRMKRALDLVPGRQSVVWELRRMANQLRGVDATPGRYADAVANASDLSTDARYEILAERDVLKRFERLIALLESRAGEGAPAHVPPVHDPRLN